MEGYNPIAKEKTIKRKEGMLFYMMVLEIDMDILLDMIIMILENGYIIINLNFWHNPSLLPVFLTAKAFLLQTIWLMMIMYGTVIMKFLMVVLSSITKLFYLLRPTKFWCNPEAFANYCLPGKKVPRSEVPHVEGCCSIFCEDCIKYFGFHMQKFEGLKSFHNYENA
jgi:hypothetical protein